MAIVLYEGNSLIDGKPIIVLAAKTSSNRKTGEMMQTYILRKDHAPTVAIALGHDRSICGDCKHRGDGKKRQRSCYVNVAHGPSSIWNSFARGIPNSYLSQSGKFSPNEIITDLEAYGKDKVIRLGAYGDPAAVPFEFWQKLTAQAKGYTGYTHQWLNCDPRFKQLCMASTDTPFETLTAKRNGWRTFRVREIDTGFIDGEVVCPATTTDVQCNQCLACNGTMTGRKGTIVIDVHGITPRITAFNKIAASYA